ncbi:MAG TPA: hypothetical protein VFO73_03605 [Candidatus Limnocylindrales bacterium]|nr:hypothetical protein [Candidatus Limnocylindrales bacterium]
MTALAGLLPKLAAFLIATILGGSVTYVAASAVNRPEVASVAREAPDYLLGAKGGAVAAFDLIDAQRNPTVLTGLPPDDLALASATLIDDEPPAGTSPLGFPRVPPVSQFDGGPFAGSNCTLAAGAMLARLGFGIVTSGSILRTLQSDQVGGTDLHDLQNALFHGYGVQFKVGTLKPAQLKSLLGAGYGAVIQGDYGEIPPGLRLQRNFDDPHAIYLDGYYPGDAATPEAYYVIDPLGRGGSYDGDWWPASIVDAFGLGFSSGGRISAAWVFPPGGVAPEVVGPDVLPLPPGGGPDSTPGPGDTPAPSGSGEPTVDEPGDAEPPTPPVLGDPPLADPGTFGDIDLSPVFTVCLFEPIPPGCPSGVEGIYDVDLPILSVDLGPDVEIRFIDSDTPNIALVGFTVDPGAPADVRFWEADGSPATVSTASSMASLELLGQPMTVARLDVLAGTAYHFQVVAGDGLFATSSAVGTFTTGGGVKAFDVAIATEASPAFAVELALSPYVHLAAGSLAPPLLPLDGPVPAACLDLIIDFGGSTYCPSDGTADASCTQATVSYELVGIDSTAVLVRAFPTEAGEVEGGGASLAGILEVEGPAPGGTVEIGCLGSGLTYSIVLDAIGDADGIIGSRELAVP